RLINRFAAVGAPAAWAGARASKSRSHVRTVRWKPGRRAVLELDLVLGEKTSGLRRDWRAFARVLPVHELGARVERWRAAATIPGLPAPAVVFVDEERGWFATAVAPGSALVAAPGEGARASLRAALGAAHAAPAPGLPTRGEPEDLGAAVRALAALAQAAPELRTRAHALSGALH